MVFNFGNNCSSSTKLNFQKNMLTNIPDDNLPMEFVANDNRVKHIESICLQNRFSKTKNRHKKVIQYYKS